MSTQKSDVSEKDDLLETARERFALAQEAIADSHKLAIEDREFLAGNQWPEEIKNKRTQKGRPCLVINRLPQHARQVTNDARQNRPSIKVYPVDDKADVETAKVLQGMVKHIETNSNADVAYDTAFDGAVKNGFGYLRVTTDYSDPETFEQDILIKRIRNPLSVFLDPHAQEPDGSDARFGFIVDDVSHDDFKSQFPDSELCKASDWNALADQTPGWLSEKTCRIAEYFYRDDKTVELAQLDDGKVVPLEQVPEDLRHLVVNTRKTKVPVIRWAKINAIEILEETVWPGRWIPIIPVYGDEEDLNGRVILKGIIRDAKDPQRMYNYWASSETEMIALAPKAPFIGAEGQFEGYEDQWRTANVENHAFLEYKPVALNGTLAPPPQRNVFEAPVQAISQARMMSSEDLKATTGIYDASLGNRSNENSGIAIQRRNMQAQTANFHFVDNLTRSLKHVGRILVDLIPKVYDTTRVARIIGEEGDQKVVTVNGQPQPGSTQNQIYDLSIGKYDVVCDVGPSFATKRQEAVQSMLDMTRAYPQIAQVAGDLLVKNMDWPGAKEVAERLKKTLPPGLADDDQSGPPLPPQVKAQMGQMNQMIEQLTHQLNDSNEILKQKRMELESRERIAMAEIQAKVEIELFKGGQKDSHLLLQQEIAQIEQRLNLLGQQEPIQTEVNEQMPDQQMPEQQPTGGISPGLPTQME